MTVGDGVRSKLSANRLKGSVYYISGNGGEASHVTENNGWLDVPFDCRRAKWAPANNSVLLDPMIDQTMNVGLSGHPDNIYTFPSGSFENPGPFSFDCMLPQPVDYSLLAASSSHPIFAPFLEAGSDGSQSSWSSPSSTYSALYTANFNDDVLSLSLPNNASQDSLLYNLL